MSESEWEKINQLAVSVAGLKADMEWVKRAIWIVATAVVGNMMGMFFLVVKSTIR